MDRLGWILEGLGSSLPVLGAALVIVIYGLVAAWLMGTRRWLLALAGSIPVAVAVLAISAQITGMAGLSVPIPVDALIGLALASLLGLITWRWSARTSMLSLDTDPGIVVWLGIAIGALVTLAVWTGGIGNQILPPQGHDDIWHGYLVERLTHMPVITADSVAPTDPITARPVLYYQYGLHLAWALGHTLTGVSVPEILNGGWMVHVGLLLPVGNAALAWSLFPNRQWVAFWSAVLAPSVVVFPYLTNGLLPYTASLAMIPGLLAILVAYLHGRRGVPSWGPALAAVGIFVTHPTGAVVGGIVSALIAVEVVVRRRKTGEALATGRRVVTLAVVAAVAGLPWILAAGERGLGFALPLVEVDLPTAISRVVLLGTPWTSPQPVLALLVGAGLVATIVGRRGIGLGVSFLAFTILSIGTMAGLEFFAAVTQSWHAHWYRIAAAFGVLVPVLAGLGIAGIVGTVRGRIGDGSDVTRRATMAATGAIVVVAMIGAAYASAQGQSIIRTAWHASPLVRAEDIELFGDLADLTGPEDRIFNSPRDGSGWMYAIAGALPRHPYAYGTPQWSWDLVNGVEPYSTAAAACAGLAREGVTYAIVKVAGGPAAESDAYDIAGFVDRYPELFDELVRTESAVAYRIDQQALDECLAG